MFLVTARLDMRGGGVNTQDNAPRFEERRNRRSESTDDQNAGGAAEICDMSAEG